MNSNFHRDCKLHSAAANILEGEIFLPRTHGERAEPRRKMLVACERENARPFDQYAENEREGGAAPRSVVIRVTNRLCIVY